MRESELVNVLRESELVNVCERERYELGNVCV